MQPATAPYMLRSLYKDDYLAEQSLGRPATELLTHIFGAVWTNRHDVYIGPMAKGVYTFVAALHKSQTLGEEFCDILPVIHAPRWALVGLTRVLLLATLQAAQPSLLFYSAHKICPSLAPHDVLANVHKIVLCAFFLFERYCTLPHRLLRIRYLGLKPSQQVQSGDGARGTYLVLGLVLLVELVVRLYRFERSRRQNERQQQQQQQQQQQRRAGAMGVSDRGGGERNNNNNNKSSDEDDDDDDKKASAHVTGKCMLCLGHRKQPTATQCGHIFCWSCIAEWIQSNAREAVCPFCRQRITASSLVPLFFYVAPPPQRLGHGSDDGDDGKAKGSDTSHAAAGEATAL